MNYVTLELKNVTRLTCIIKFNYMFNIYYFNVNFIKVNMAINFKKHKLGEANRYL